LGNTLRVIVPPGYDFDGDGSREFPPANLGAFDLRGVTYGVEGHIYPAGDKPRARLRRRLVLAEVDRDPPFLVLEDGDELEPRAESFEVLTERRDADVVGVLELGDRPLRDVEAAGELDLADGLGVTELVEPDLLEGLGALRGEALLGAGPSLDFVAELGELGSCHQINPSRFSSSRYSS
jgi:hypothetical protein